MPLAIKVVLVEDSDSYRRVLRRLLESEGLEVVGEAGDGCAGIMAVRHWKPDLIISDYLMPVMDGIAMSAYLKRAPEAPPILMLTGQEIWQVEGRATAAGVDRVLTKGCTLDELFDTIEALTYRERVVSYAAD